MILLFLKCTGAVSVKVMKLTVKSLLIKLTDYCDKILLNEVTLLKLVILAPDGE